MSGWPWPLDAVQRWFEGLWDWIGTAATNAVKPVADWINNSAAWLWNQMTAVGGWLALRFAEVGASIGLVVSEVGKVVFDNISAALSAVQQGTGAAFNWIWEQLVSIGNWITGSVFSWIDGALRWATDSFKWLQSVIGESAAWIVGQLGDVIAGIPTFLSNLGEEIMGGLASTGDWIVDQVGIAFDGAFSVVGDAIGSVFGPIITPITNFLGAFTGIAAAFDPARMMADVQAGLASLNATMTEAFTSSSPRTPEEAFNLAWAVIEETTKIYITQTTNLAIAEAVSLGQLDVTPARFLDTPQLQAGYRLVQDLYSTMNEAALVIPLRQYFMRAFTPMIPPAADIISMVVREAFVPEMVTPAPDVFAQYMELSGYNREWSDRYWTAHWVPIALTQAYDNLHRGYWDKEKFMRALTIADIHPMWREDIYNVAFRPMSRLELRHGWETGVVSDEKMVANFRALGLSPEDAEIAAAASREYALAAERNAVITEWRVDFEDGLITEDTFRANLESIGAIGPRQDYYVARGTIRRERQLKKDLLDRYRDGFMKDLVTEEDLRDRVLEILAIPEVADMFIEKAYVDKYKKPKPPQKTKEEEALEELQKYQVTYAIQAYRRYAVDKPELVTMLIAAGVDPAVAATRADYEELKRPIPKPTATEIAAAKEQTRVQKLQESAAIAAFRAGTIDADGLLRALLALGYSDVLATAITQVEVIRKG